MSTLQAEVEAPEAPENQADRNLPRGSYLVIGANVFENGKHVGTVEGKDLLKLEDGVQSDLTLDDAREAVKKSAVDVLDNN